MRCADYRIAAFQWVRLPLLPIPPATLMGGCRPSRNPSFVSGKTGVSRQSGGGRTILPPPCYVSLRFLLQQCQTAGVVGKCHFGVALGDDNRRQLIDGDINLAIVYTHIRSGHAVACLQGLDDRNGLGYEHIGELCNGEKAISSSRSTALQFPCISVSALHGGTRGFQQNQKRKCQLRYANVLFCNSKWPQ